MFDWTRLCGYRRTVVDRVNMLERLATDPLLVAVEFADGSRWWPGRASEWIRDSSGWSAFVLAEEARGGSAGWMPIIGLRPAQHEVSTACLSTDWSV